MSRRTTLQELADELRVSRTTVSYVLSGQAEQRRIAPATAKRVEELARARNYVPNGIARSLRSRRSGTIGVVTSDFLHDCAHELFMGMQGVFEPASRTPLFVLHGWDPMRERRELEMLTQRRVDGIIVSNPQDENRREYRRLLEQGMPLLFVQDTLVDAEWANYVVWDSAAATKRVVSHLIETGRRRIGFLTRDSSSRMSRLRRWVYEETLREAGLPVRDDWRLSLPRAGGQHSWTLLGHWLDSVFGSSGQTPDAFFALNDGEAFHLNRALRARGIDVPGEVAVAGMSNMRYLAEQGDGITSMVEPLERLGEAAARAMGQLIEERPRQPIQQAIEHNELIVRGSTRGATSPSEESLNPSKGGLATIGDHAMH